MDESGINFDFSSLRGELSSEFLSKTVSYIKFKDSHLTDLRISSNFETNRSLQRRKRDRISPFVEENEYSLVMYIWICFKTTLTLNQKRMALDQFETYAF